MAGKPLLKKGGRRRAGQKKPARQNKYLGNVSGLPVIGDSLGAIEYYGGDGKRTLEELKEMGVDGSPGRPWRHDFKKTGAKLLGLPDGSLLIRKGKKRLWSMFKGT